MTLIPAGVSRKLVLKVFVVLPLRDGKRQVGREYWDSASVTRQLGVSDSQLSVLVSVWTSRQVAALARYSLALRA